MTANGHNWIQTPPDKTGAKILRENFKARVAVCCVILRLVVGVDLVVRVRLNLSVTVPVALIAGPALP